MARAGRWIILLAALLTAGLTARLGVWQLDRAQRKIDLQQTLERRTAMPELDAGGLAQAALDPQAFLQRRIQVAGHWQHSATIYLDNRQMQGRPGFYVITPLLLADGRSVLVQRGWQPRDPRDRARVIPPPTPGGNVVVLGRIAPPPARLFEFQGSESGPIRQNVSIEALAAEFRLRLLPLSVLQEGTSPRDDGLQRDWPAPAADVHKHYGYAFQWFALSVLTLALYVWFQVLRPRRRAS